MTPQWLNFVQHLIDRFDLQLVAHTVSNLPAPGDSLTKFAHKVARTPAMLVLTANFSAINK